MSEKRSLGRNIRRVGQAPVRSIRQSLLGAHDRRHHSVSATSGLFYTGRGLMIEKWQTEANDHVICSTPRVLSGRPSIVDE